MKKLYSFIVAVLITATLTGQAQAGLKYQAVVRNPGGTPIVSTQVGMRISILQGSASGSAVCVEEFTPTTNAFGLVTLEIGSANTAAFGAIDWSAGPYFAKVELDPDGSVGGIVYEDMGTSQLLSVPYALYAKTAGTVTETDPQVGANTTDFLPKWNGTALVTSPVFSNGNLGIANPAALNTDVETEIALKTGDYYTGLMKTVGTGSMYARLGLYTWASFSKNDLQERLTILDNGNIGIGTTTPGSELEVNGTVDADAFTVNGTPLTNNWSKNGSDIYYNAGKVGIGTSVPGWPLDVNGQIRLGAHLIANNPRGSLILNSGPDNSDESLSGIFFRKTDVQGDPTNYTELVRITDEGKVGIGTTSPLSKLSFGNYVVSTFDPTPQEQTSTLRLYDIGDGSLTYGFGVSNSSLNIAANQSGALIRLYTNGTERTRVSEEGLRVNGKIYAGMTTGGAGYINGQSIEIGGTSPTATNGEATIHFHHHGAIAHQLRYTNGTLYLEADGFGYGTSPTPNLDVGGNIHATSFTGDGSALTGISGGTGGIANPGSTTIGADTDANGSGEIALQTQNTTRMTVANNGNVGIGTATPGNKLDVVGYINTGMNYGFSIDGSPVLRNIGPTGVMSLLVGAGAGQNMPSNINLINIAVGNHALFTNTTGSQNIAIGDNALYLNSGGHWNVGIGRNALYSNTTGKQNTAVGNYALFANTVNDYNTAIGYYALKNTAGFYNTAIGFLAGAGTFPTSTFESCVLVGSYAGQNLTTAQDITAIGMNALNFNTTGSFNTAVGKSALEQNTIGTNNTAVGTRALALNTEGSRNSVFGNLAMYSNKWGYLNVIIGDSALFFNESPAMSTGIGAKALTRNIKFTGMNTALGYAAGYGAFNSFFENCLLLGVRAGYSLKNGNNNLLIGYQAGDDITSGSNNIIIGYDISTPTPTTSNHLNIGNMVFSDLSAGKVGIGTATPGQKLTVAGIIESTSGGIKFPDGTVQASAATGGGGGAHFVGELFGGGVIFWVDHTGDHGLICSMIDVSTSQQWSDVTSTEIGSAAQSDWDGLNNSNAIVGQPGHTASAAKLCLDYTNTDYGTGIYDDWYLPSRGELNNLWNNIYQVHKALESDGNSVTTVMAKGYYWSSEEAGSGNAWSFGFHSGSTASGYGKSDAISVRAVRAF